jgi:hypothetical protein
MDAGALWYRSLRYRSESLASTPNSIVHWTGDHLGRSPILLSLAEGHYRYNALYEVRPNQSMKPTAADRVNASNLATTPCRGLSLSR